MHVADADDIGRDGFPAGGPPSLDRAATAADVQLVHLLLLGRENRRAEAVGQHVGRPLRLVIQAVARAAEFTTDVVPAIIRGTLPPHAALGMLPDATLRNWVAMLLGAAPPAAGWGGFLTWALTTPHILRSIEEAAPPAAQALRTLAAARSGMASPGLGSSPASAPGALAPESRPGPGRVTVVAWDMGRNPVARAHMLAELAAPAASVELVGPTFEREGHRIWPPLAYSAMATRSIAAHDLRSLVAGAVAIADTTQCDLVHVGKPRLASLLIGALIRSRTGCPMLLDIDDHELAFVTDQAPADFAELEAAAVSDPEAFATPRSAIWTRFCATLVSEADGITVSSATLQDAYGGTILRHARDETLFDPARMAARSCRAGSNNVSSRAWRRMVPP